LSAIQEEFDFDLDAEEMLDIEDLNDIVTVVKDKIAS
jgi:acyl carrier protein